MSGVLPDGRRSLPLSLAWLGAVSVAVWAVFGLASAMREYRAADRAAAGDGRLGVFTAQVLQCSRDDCSWYGTFATDRTAHNRDWLVRLRDPDPDSIVQGQMVPAIDVGARDDVYATAASPTPARAAAGPLIFGSLFGSLGAAAVLILARRTWNTVTRRPPGRAVVAARRGWTRDILTKDRWAPVTRGRSEVQVHLIRSPGRTIAWGIAFPFLTLFSLAPLAAALDELHRRVEFEYRLMLAWFVLASVFPIGLVLQISRMLVLRPRVRVSGDGIVLRDSVLLWKTVRIRREDIAAVHHKEGEYLMPGRYAELTPFRESPNLDLLFRAELPLAGRHLRWGNWIWLAQGRTRELADRPRLPRGDETYRRLLLRVKQPEQTAEELRRWLAHDAPDPTARQPGFEPTDHFMHGRSTTHRGTGDRTITVKGTLPQPVLARIGNEGPSVLHATLHQTGHRRGQPLASVHAGEAPARVVLDDEPRTANKRQLRVRAAGSWTVTLAGPETAPEFDRAIHGEGADVVAYTGPQGIGVLDAYGGFAHVLQRRPDLTLEHGRLHMAQAALHRRRREIRAPVRTAFAVPAGAILQISVEGDWALKVLPLRLAPGTHDLLEGRGVNHLRTFENSATGSRTEVLLYTGPHTNLAASYKGKGGIMLHRLDDGLTSATTHVITARHNKRIEMRPWTLLQISGDGLGRWHLRPSG